MRKIDTIFIHCSDTPDDRDIRAKHIRDWHVDNNGWDDIGYHWVIPKDGELEEGRLEAMVGAGVYGHNKRSIHICWVGRDTLNWAQRKTLMDTVFDICERYNLKPEAIKGHYEADPDKTCPNLDMDEFRQEMRFKYVWL